MRVTHAEGQLDLDLVDPATWADLHGVFAQLHALEGLARTTQPMGLDGWVIARYDDVARVLKDPQRFRSDPRGGGRRHPLDLFFWTPRLVRSFSQTMIGADGPDHRRLRRLANKAFTPTRVRALTGHVRAVTEALLEEAAQQREFDLIRAFALPLPLRIISELLGVDEAERGAFHAMLQGVLEVGVTPWKLLLRTPTFYRLYRFFERLLERKRLDPADDIISALIAAEEEGDRLTADELIGTVFLLLFAGHETTVNLIGNGTLALLDYPEQLALLREDPARVPGAVEEMLRFHSPATQASPRYVAEPCELAGVPLERGAILVPMVGAANHDPAAFEQPERFDVTRSPNEHLAFGAGPHFCIGAHLSRLEGRLAFEALLTRFDSLRVVGDRERLTWRGNSTGLRGLKALPVAVD